METLVVETFLTDLYIYVCFSCYRGRTGSRNGDPVPRRRQLLLLTIRLIYELKNPISSESFRKSCSSCCCSHIIMFNGWMEQIADICCSRPRWSRHITRSKRTPYVSSPHCGWPLREVNTFKIVVMNEQTGDGKGKGGGAAVCSFFNPAGCLAWPAIRSWPHRNRVLVLWNTRQADYNEIL